MERLQLSRWPGGEGRLTFENDGVASENLELVHLGLCHFDDRVVVLLGVFNLQLMGRFLAVHNRSRVVLLGSEEHKWISESHSGALTRRLSSLAESFAFCL